MTYFHLIIFGDRMQSIYNANPTKVIVGMVGRTHH